ncbi:periplasmic heavy metal sensor [Sulfitobacter sp. LCG007]
MPDDIEMSPGGRTRERWLKPLLVFSLAVNLLIIGAIAGTAWRHGGPGPGHAHPDEPGGRGFAFVRALPDEERARLRESFRAARDQRDAGREERAAIEREVLDAIRADPIDPERLEALLARQTALGAEVQTMVQDEWLAQVLAMDAPGRAAYADRVSRMLDRDARERRD